MAKRRIYTKRRTGKRQVVRGTAAAIIVVALIYFAVAGGLGTWIADTFIVPNMGDTGDALPTLPPVTTALPSQGQQAETTPDILQTSEEVTFSSVPIYAIQLGAFANEANAENEADTYKLRGAAGYIFQDTDRSRVLASAYLTRKEADTVKAQLLEMQGVESFVLELYQDVGEITLKVTAPPERIAAMREGLVGWRSALDQLADIAKQLDLGEIGPVAACNQIAEMSDALEKQRLAIVGNASVEGSSEAIDTLTSIMANMVKRLEGISSNNQGNAMAISSQIKYTYIESLVKYGQALRSITTASSSAQ